MKTDDIPYKNLSTDYERLYDLLKNGYIITGFHSLYHEKYVQEKSMVNLFSYSSEFMKFELDGTLFEDMFNKEQIIKHMKEANIRYFDIEL